ncbi:hypothetical protein D557_0465 [Bordetella holmesii 70147]|nr:hypothetical protein D557_0465 [Bordetella holmesii 70147]
MGGDGRCPRLGMRNRTGQGLHQGALTCDRVAGFQGIEKLRHGLAPLL